MRASFYATVETARLYDGRPNSIKVKGLTQSKPNKLTKNQIAVKLTIDVPPEAFMAFEPEAIIEIPASLVQQPSVEVEVSPASGSDS